MRSLALPKWYPWRGRSPQTVRPKQGRNKSNTVQIERVRVYQSYSGELAFLSLEMDWICTSKP